MYAYIKAYILLLNKGHLLGNSELVFCSEVCSSLPALIECTESTWLGKKEGQIKFMVMQKKTYYTTWKQSTGLIYLTL